MAAAVSGLLVVGAGAAGCTSSGASTATTASPSGPTSASSSPTATPRAEISLNLDRGAEDVAVDTMVVVKADRGRLQRVKITGGEDHARLDGRLTGNGASWKASGRLEPGTTYDVKAVATNAAGDRTVERRSFHTQALTLDQQTYPSIAPLEGETVGVGMPVVIHFDVAVTDRASIEKHLSVESSPHQVGAWHWLNDNEVHWRPKTYWKAGTDVTVNADINSVPAGNGIFGQLSRTIRFHVGDSIVSKVDVKAHEMTVFINGKAARTMPISAGKPGFITRSGTKVIISKTRHKVMDAATIGIAKDDPEYYNLEVEYAMRVTYSGEFLHAAPWSAGAQGIANTSHGCVGMSMENAAWLFNMTKRGDVVEVTGSDRHMTLENGYGDWVESFQEYKQGSALS